MNRWSVGACLIAASILLFITGNLVLTKRLLTAEIEKSAYLSEQIALEKRDASEKQEELSNQIHACLNAEARARGEFEHAKKIIAAREDEILASKNAFDQAIAQRDAARKKSSFFEGRLNEIAQADARERGR